MIVSLSIFSTLDLDLNLDPHLHLDLLKNPYSPCPVRLSAECGGSKERAFCVILVDFRQAVRKALEYRVRPWVIVAGGIHLPSYGPQFTDSNSVVSGCGFQKYRVGEFIRVYPLEVCRYGG